MKAPSTAVLFALLLMSPLALPIERSSVEVSGASFGIIVADLKASTGWYTEKLGLKVTREIPEAKVVILEGEGLIVELIQQEAGPKPATPTRGILKVGLLLRNYQGTLSRLQSLKTDIAYGPFPAQGGQRANVIIKDNEGNLIQLLSQ